MRGCKKIYKEDWCAFLPAFPNANISHHYSTILKTKN